MNRRRFLALPAAAAMWPLAARAQQPAMPVIGFLHVGGPQAHTRDVVALRQGLNEKGYVEGRNIAIDYRWAEGQYDRVPASAAALVRRQVNVIVAAGGAAPRAAKTATATIPIVIVTGVDPVDDGLVASLNRPGGNLTGINILTTALEPKRLELLHELLPRTDAIALLVNPTHPAADAQVREVEAAGGALGRRIVVLKASDASGIDTAFATLVERRIGALLVASDPFFNGRRAQLVALTTRHAVPAIFQWRDFAVDGGLMSYGTSLSDAYRQAGIYVGRILGGEKPADLPIHQSTKVELVINMKTAKALGLTFPLTLLGRADEVIE